MLFSCFRRCDGITGLDFENLRGMPLRHLVLDYILGLDGETLGAIKDCPLTYLSLRECGDLMDTGLLALRGAMQLTYLDLTRCCHITDVGLDALQGMPLDKLFLAGSLVSRNALYRFLGASPTLKDFHFGGIGSISSEDEAWFWRERFLKLLQEVEAEKQGDK